MKPHRRIEMRVTISADTFKDAVQEIGRLADHVAEHGEECSLCSGGYSCGSTVTITVDPEMTHERYAEELKTWLNENKDKP